MMAMAIQSSSKHQRPNSREAPNFKFQKPASDCGVWNLVIEVSLELGAWNLEL
jgi:hypothetical protein